MSVWCVCARVCAVLFVWRNVCVLDSLRTCTHRQREQCVHVRVHSVRENTKISLRALCVVYVAHMVWFVCEGVFFLLLSFVAVCVCVSVWVCGRRCVGINVLFTLCVEREFVLFGVVVWCAHTLCVNVVCDVFLLFFVCGVCNENHLYTEISHTQTRAHGGQECVSTSCDFYFRDSYSIYTHTQRNTNTQTQHAQTQTQQTTYTHRGNIQTHTHTKERESK